MDVALVPEEDSHDPIHAIDTKIMHFCFIEFQGLLFQCVCLEVRPTDIKQDDTIFLVEDSNVLACLGGFDKAWNQSLICNLSEIAVVLTFDNHFGIVYVYCYLTEYE